MSYIIALNLETSNSAKTCWTRR